MKTHYNTNDTRNAANDLPVCRGNTPVRPGHRRLQLTTDQRKVTCGRCLSWLGMTETDARHWKNNPEVNGGRA